MNKSTMINDIPVLVTRGILVFPKTEKIVEVGRKKSINAIKKSLTDFDGNIILLSQKDLKDDEPEIKDIYGFGVIATVKVKKEWNGGIISASFKAINRVKIENLRLNKDFYLCNATLLKSKIANNKEKDILIQDLMQLDKNFNKWFKINFIESYFSNDIINNNQEKKIDYSYLVDAIADTIEVNLKEIDFKIKQSILEELDILKRLNIISNFVLLSFSKKINIELDNKINKKIKDHVDEQQKEFYLREKLKVIKSELGDENNDKKIKEYYKRLNSEPFPKVIKEKVLSEILRYESLPQSSSESNIIRSYIDVVMALPWFKKSSGNKDLNYAKSILEKYHFGLKKVKERIIEFLAVKMIVDAPKGQIICFVGPPGVGKTSLAKSISEATGLEFVKLSLGGIKDESEIRGHRKTYIGAMPGRIIQSMKKCKTINPVFLLDEIDKMASDSRGDPASAMLEVLDPEQNKDFTDHYIEEPYNLSQVMFIATANYVDNIPEALYDRMEIIELSSYTELEKKEIGKKYLIKKILKENNVKPSQLSFTDCSIDEIIKFYTRESGVRQLKRCIESIVRKFIVKFLNKEIDKLKVTAKVVNNLLGKRKFEHTDKSKNSEVGVVTGLAYTQYGGDILPIEVNKFSGKGNLVLTGKLGDVMKESASIALGYIKSNCKKFGIDENIFKNYDIHIHVPEGAVPKDGPSAGITITTAIISSLTNKPVSKNIAMTGEITLRGNILPIGGLREKSISANRSKIETIIIPSKNTKNLDDIPDEVKKQLQILNVSKYDEVYKLVFSKQKMI